MVGEGVTAVWATVVAAIRAISFMGDGSSRSTRTNSRSLAASSRIAGVMTADWRAKPFCKAMKRQHAAIQRNFEKFQRMTAELSFAPEPSLALAEVRQYGLLVSRQLLQHMNAEDKRIAELLG